MSLTKDDLREIQRIVQATVEPLLVPINKRLDKLETGQEKLEAGQEKLEAGQEKLEAGQEKLEAGQEKLEARLGKVETRLGKVETRLDKVETRLDKVDTRLDKVDTRLDKAESRQDRTDELLQSIRDSQVRVELEWLPRIELAYEGLAALLDKDKEQDKRLSKLENTSENHGNRIFNLEHNAKAI